MMRERADRLDALAWIDWKMIRLGSGEAVGLPMDCLSVVGQNRHGGSVCVYEGEKRR